MTTVTTPLGGSEILYNKLRSLIEIDDRINLILSTCDFRLLDPTKINIIWQHLSYDQQGVALLSNADFVSKVQYFVFVSHWQYEKFRSIFNLPSAKCFVVQNATDSIVPADKPKDKVKLIYTSTPWRGLELLLEAYSRLDRDDIELEIYSGTSIYGPSFAQTTKGQYDALYERAKTLKNCTHTEYAPNAEVKKALQSAHIFAYPSVFEETSCLAAIEAMTHGCRAVVSNLGALPETCGSWARYIPIGNDLNNFVDRYTEILNQEIDSIFSDRIQNKLNDQVAYYNKYWTWDARVNEWSDVIDTIQVPTEISKT